MTEQQPEEIVLSLNIKEYAAIRLFVDVPTVRNKHNALEALREAEYRKGSRPAPETERTNQCQTCAFAGSRRCTSHGYPESEIPKSCQYKIGESALFAQENFKGTHLEWSALKEHDAAIASKASEDVLIRLRNHFKSFEDQKRFAYSAADIVEYVETFMKRESLQHEAHK